MVDLAHLPGWNLLVAVVSGGVATKAIDWAATRGRSKAYTMGAVDHAVQTAMESVTGQLERTEARLGVVEEQHNKCQADLQEVRNELNDAKAEIGRLMSGEVPAYKPGDLQRVRK